MASFWYGYIRNQTLATKSTGICHVYHSTLNYSRGVKLVFTEGHISIMVTLKGPVVTV